MGVAIAPKANESRTATRQPPNQVRPSTMPTLVSITMMTGSRKPAPKASTIRMTNVRYSWAEMRLVESAGVNPVSTPTALGSSHHARNAPVRNSGTAAPRNPTVMRRSRRVRPGVMNAQSW